MLSEFSAVFLEFHALLGHPLTVDHGQVRLLGDQVDVLAQLAVVLTQQLGVAGGFGLRRAEIFPYRSQFRAHVISVGVESADRTPLGRPNPLLGVPVDGFQFAVGIGLQNGDLLLQRGDFGLMPLFLSGERRIDCGIDCGLDPLVERVAHRHLNGVEALVGVFLSIFEAAYDFSKQLKRPPIAGIERGNALAVLLNLIVKRRVYVFARFPILGHLPAAFTPLTDLAEHGLTEGECGAQRGGDARSDRGVLENRKGVVVGQ
ncbi:hypothetical protein [Fodinicola feengrottensis]|uniref:hypothetical protein n=1 Tax=Fodinicola feengrottensis TaxID=435914 RepID=UPI0013D3F2C8|nr:hypothetical protein [Fodinicola feengrottensis]